MQQLGTSWYFFCSVIQKALELFTHNSNSENCKAKHNFVWQMTWWFLLIFCFFVSSRIKWRGSRRCSFERGQLVFIWRFWNFTLFLVLFRTIPGSLFLLSHFYYYLSHVYNICLNVFSNQPSVILAEICFFCCTFISKENQFYWFIALLFDSHNPF